MLPTLPTLAALAALLSPHRNMKQKLNCALPFQNLRTPNSFVLEVLGGMRSTFF
jgi:hypothetical protein